MTLVYHTGDFHTGIEGQVVNKPSIENVTSKSKGSAGLQCLDDAGSVLAAPRGSGSHCGPDARPAASTAQSDRGNGGGTHPEGCESGR